jgi:hypothetical protein
MTLVQQLTLSFTLPLLTSPDLSSPHSTSPMRDYAPLYYTPTTRPLYAYYPKPVTRLLVLASRANLPHRTAPHHLPRTCTTYPTADMRA